MLKAEMSGVGRGEMGRRHIRKLDFSGFFLSPDWNCKMVGLFVGGDVYLVVVTGGCPNKDLCTKWFHKQAPRSQQHSDTPQSHARYSNAANVVLAVSLPPLLSSVST